MSNIFWKNFYQCFFKLKCSPMILPPPSPSSQDHNLSTPLIITNFNSLYDPTFSASDDFFSSDDLTSSDSSDSPPDFATVFASQRFFFSSPGSSNSILDSPPDPDTQVAGGVAVQTYSSDPYADFRRSMQEMVDARDVSDVKSDWDFLHELLLCYLNLNPKHTHKFIIRAFSDLIVSIMPLNSHRKIEDSHHCAATSRRLV